MSDYNEDAIEPLTSQQQIFLQRFLASHVLTDNEAQFLYNQILQSPQFQQSQPRNELGQDLNDTLSRINRSLKPAFRLEIKSVSLASPFTRGTSDDDTSNDNRHSGSASGSNSSGNRGQVKPIIYHTIINCDPDDVAKTNSNPTFTKSPHELAFFRLLLERFIEKNSIASTSGTSSDNRNGRQVLSGCNAFMSRMDMINLRLDLEGLHKDKLTITQVEHVLDLLETQGWLIPAHPMEDSDGTGNYGTDATPEPQSSKRRRRRSQQGSDDNDSDRKHSKYLQIGPRSYLEFPDFLVEAGLDKDSIPQFLLH